MKTVVKKRNDLASKFEERLRIPRFYAFTRIALLFLFSLAALAVFFVGIFLFIKKVINSELVLFLLGLLIIFIWMIRNTQRKGSRFVWWRPLFKD
ncbi:MAG TPA: hypothetical protein PLO44_01960 [Candidatus Paceibacterota bacterium]|nr:hypothetical protein [Candidatus Paceibacterota bacterium]